MSALGVTARRVRLSTSIIRLKTTSCLNLSFSSGQFTQSSPLRRPMTIRPLFTQIPSSPRKVWLDLNPDTIQEHIDRNLDDREVPIDRKNIIFLPGDTVLKTGPEHCRTDYAWLRIFDRCSLPDWVRVPKLRSSLVEFRWEGVLLYAFAMEKINVPALEEVFKTRPISDELADRIIEGLCSLRTAVATVKSFNAVPGLDKCLLQGHMFPPNEEDCRIVSSQDEVKQILDVGASEANEFVGSWEWAWGDCSPGNIYVSPTDEKIIYYADFGYAMSLPPGYDLWTLKTSHYSPEFTAPLIRAFARKNITIPPVNLEAFTKIRDQHRRV